MFSYGYLQQYVSNVLSQNIYLQVDAEGYQYQLMDDIIYHGTNVHAVHGDDDFIASRLGRNTRRCTTKDWLRLLGSP